MVKAGALFGAGLVGASGLLLMTRYHVCRPNQVLVRTGLGIPKLSLSRKGIRWPFQMASMIDLTPLHFTVKHHSITKERLEFMGDVNVTVASDNPFESEEKCANFHQFLTRCGSLTNEQVIEEIKPVLANEIRALMASLGYETLWSDREKFRTGVTAKLQKDLEPFGLHVVNIGLGEMTDAKDSTFLSLQREKALKEVEKDIGIKKAQFEKEKVIISLFGFVSSRFFRLCAVRCLR